MKKKTHLYPELYKEVGLLDPDDKILADILATRMEEVLLWVIASKCILLMKSLYAQPQSSV